MARLRKSPIDCLFVTPPLDGPVTGGTLYNRQLIAAVDALAPSLRVAQCSLEKLASAPRAQQLWVDSLYLDALPSLRQPGTRLGLLLHYLPSLLTRPALSKAAELTASERDALSCADMILTPGKYLQRLVTDLCPGKACVCVTPGVEGAAAEQLGGSAQRDGSVLLICNVTPNKGVLPFLRALGTMQQGLFSIAIAGSLELDPGYAQECVAACRQHAWLSEHVEFLGSVAPSEVLQRLARASVFVSTSTMESYGMALAEARALGTPILALPGGNIAEHIAADSGGALLPDARALAAALCALMGDPLELLARQERARATASAREWSEAAAAFLSASRMLAQRLSPASGKPSG